MALYAFDGTCDRRDRKEAIRSLPSQYGPDACVRRDTTETNVHRFCEYIGLDRSEYLEGVGTRFWRIGWALGGAFGFGGKYRIRKMYRALCSRYWQEHDREIDIIGFSRGAALAVHFTHVIERYGVRNPALGYAHLFWYYPGLGWMFRFPAPTPEGLAKVRFLGLWDMVTSFGIPGIEPGCAAVRRWWIATVPEGWRRRLNVRLQALVSSPPGRWCREALRAVAYWTSDIPANVARSFHAMALDEVRPVFQVTRPQGVAERNRNWHYEVWFRGVHSNIGGSYPDRGLSDIALAWMMEMYIWTLERDGGAKAPQPPNIKMALRLLEPEPPQPQWEGTSLETLEPDPDGELGRPYERISKVFRAWRPLPPGALIHHMANRRSRILMSDFDVGHHQLLRRIPGDATTVYDPPMLICEAPQTSAVRCARDAFNAIPVRPCDWFRLDGLYVYRGDDWVARGAEWNLAINRCSRDEFIRIATDWLLAGRPEPRAIIPTATPSAAGDQPTGDTLRFIVETLLRLEDYVPLLRSFGSHRRRPRPLTRRATAARLVAR